MRRCFQRKRNVLDRMAYLPFIKRRFTMRARCVVCREDVTAIRADMEGHVWSKHRDMVSLPWHCPVCPYSCLAKSVVNRHIVVSLELLILFKSYNS